MTILYKLTKPNLTTHGGCLWGEGITHTADGKGELCSKHWLHAYTDPRLAILLNPIHANYNPHVMWECEGIVGITDKGLKVGCTKLTTVRVIPTVETSINQHVAFGILCALEVYSAQGFRSWAEEWLANTNRSSAAATDAADAAAYAAAYAAARAARAAYAAAHAAAYAAADAAADAAAAAADAATAVRPINLITLAEKAYAYS